MPALKRPARQQQVTVAPFTDRHVELIEMGLRSQVLRQEYRLIVIVAAMDVAVHFLQTDKIRLLHR